MMGGAMEILRGSPVICTGCLRIEFYIAQCVRVRFFQARSSLGDDGGAEENARLEHST